MFWIIKSYNLNSLILFGHQQLLYCKVASITKSQRYEVVRVTLKLETPEIRSPLTVTFQNGFEE